MDRRFLTVLGVSLVFAFVASSVFYQMTPGSAPPGFTQPHPIAYSTQASVEFEQQLQSLVQGHVLFDPPDRMRLGQRETVEVRISRNVTDDLQRNLKGGGKVQVSDLQVGPFMTVNLQSRDGGLEVKPHNPEDQFVASQEFTQWSYDIRALRVGETTLLLNVGVRLKFDKGNEERRYLPAFDKQIVIAVNLPYTVGTFPSNNWRWIATTVLIPIITALVVIWWKRRAEERAKRDESRLIRPNDKDISRLR